jgi:hypothetical protein
MLRPFLRLAPLAAVALLVGGCAGKSDPAAVGPCAGQAAGTVCRAAAGSCDVAESCDGLASECPADSLADASTTCRASAGVCDVAEQCTGTSAACPGDGFLPGTTICGPVAGPCDLAEYCTGGSAACPVDELLPSTIRCRAAQVGGCDVDEFCSGTSAVCPADGVAEAGTPCRAAAPGGCDLPESCDGTSIACPADAVVDAGTVCRAAAPGGCDAAEICDGATTDCPVDLLADAGTVCRAANGSCDLSEVCSGANIDCPADAVATAAIVCRAAAGACDLAESCTGASAACPADAFAPVAVCRVPAGECDVAESCTGASAACPADAFAPVAVCRVPAGECDAAESCTGTSAACPADAGVVAGTACGSASSGVCDGADTCDGVGGCRTNLAPATTVCDAVPTDCATTAGLPIPCAACVNSSLCTGTSGACPALTLQPTNAWCTTTFDGYALSDWGCDAAGGCTVLLSINWSSCPILYAWNGGTFGFESDMYTAGTLGLRVGGKYRKPDPNDAYVLRQPLVAKDGKLELRLVEELQEIDYLDKARLFAVDVPAGHQVVAWANNVPGAATPLADRLVTIGESRRPLVSALHLQSGADVAAALAASDLAYVTLSEDHNDPYWNTIEVDLGDLSGAQVIKLIVDGRSRFPTTEAGWANRLEQDPTGLQTKLEVLDAGGAWVQVPRAQVTLVRPKEFPRAMAIDVTDAFLTGVYRMRLSWVNKTHLDAIWVDTTPNAPLTITEAPLVAAALDWHGLSAVSGGDLPVYDYGRAGPPGWPLAPGNYTRYGDVSPLLGAADDMFVVFGSGDEVAMQFEQLPPPAGGLRRVFAFESAGFYKQANLVDGGAVPYAVEPLPFGAMTNFPYPATEQYPSDPAHEEYRALWNTRPAP